MLNRETVLGARVLGLVALVLAGVHQPAHLELALHGPVGGVLRHKRGFSEAEVFALLRPC